MNKLLSLGVLLTSCILIQAGDETKNHLPIRSTETNYKSDEYSFYITNDNSNTSFNGTNSSSSTNNQKSNDDKEKTIANDSSNSNLVNPRTAYNNSHKKDKSSSSTTFNKSSDLNNILNSCLIKVSDDDGIDHYIFRVNKTDKDHTVKVLHFISEDHKIKDDDELPKWVYRLVTKQ